MKVCLIKPPSVSFADSLSVTNGIPPIGLAYIGAALMQEGHNVYAIDAIGEAVENFEDYQFEGEHYCTQGLTTQEIISRISHDTEVIAMSCMFSCEWFVHKNILQEIREAFPDVPIILGGEHVSSLYQDILKHTPVDYCVIGEGEETINELLDAISREQTSRQKLQNISGVAFKDKEHIICTPKRKRVKKIDQMPWPAWDLFPVENYLDKKLSVSSRIKRSIPILSSRGCPYKCTFCSAPNMWGTEFYQRSIDDLIQEISYYQQKYGIDNVDFVDLVGMINKKRILSLTDKLVKNCPELSWNLAPGTRIESLSPQVLNMMKKSNLLRIQLAPETGSKERAKNIQKKIDLKKLEKTLRRSVKLGLSTRAQFIFGFPGQTKREALETLLYSWKLSVLGLHDTCPQPLAVFPGTQIYFDLIKDKDFSHYIDSEKKRMAFWTRNIPSRLRSARSWSEHLSHTELRFFLLFTIASSYAIQFTLRPWRLFTVIKNTWKKQPLSLLENFLFLKLHRPKETHLTSN